MRQTCTLAALRRWIRPALAHILIFQHQLLAGLLAGLPAGLPADLNRAVAEAPAVLVVPVCRLRGQAAARRRLPHRPFCAAHLLCAHRRRVQEGCKIGEKSPRRNWSQ